MFKNYSPELSRNSFLYSTACLSSASPRRLRPREASCCRTNQLARSWTLLWWLLVQVRALKTASLFRAASRLATPFSCQNTVATRSRSRTRNTTCSVTRTSWANGLSRLSSPFLIFVFSYHVRPIQLEKKQIRLFVNLRIYAFFRILLLLYMFYCHSFFSFDSRIKKFLI